MTSKDKTAAWKLVDAYELGYEYECTNCRAKVDTTEKGKHLPLECPNCRAKMDLEDWDMDTFGIPLSNAALLEALAEESSELAHASLKLARILRGENPTPVSQEEGFKNLEEEAADVILVIKALGLNNSTRVRQIMLEKYSRLKKRLWLKHCEDHGISFNAMSHAEESREAPENWESNWNSELRLRKSAEARAEKAEKELKYLSMCYTCSDDKKCHKNNPSKESDTFAGLTNGVGLRGNKQ